MEFEQIYTHGHTPECFVYIVSDLEGGIKPTIAFRGDTLFMSDARRPDLFSDIKEELVPKQYQNLRRLEKIGGNIEAYTAHVAGSLCNKALSSTPAFTIGKERIHDSAMLKHPKKDPIKSFLKEMPEAPDHFFRCFEINRKGAHAVSKLRKLIGYLPKGFSKLSRTCRVIVDTRIQFAFGTAHIKGTYGLSLDRILPPDKPIPLVLGISRDISEVKKALYRFGLFQKWS